MLPFHHQPIPFICCTLSSKQSACSTQVVKTKDQHFQLNSSWSKDQLSIPHHLPESKNTWETVSSLKSIVGSAARPLDKQPNTSAQNFDNFQNILKFSFGNSFRSSNHGVSFGVVFTSKYQNTKKIQGR